MTQPTSKKLKLLVAIASFGDKNIVFLKEIIRAYQAMSLEVDVVVVSNAPKDLGPKVKVVVGLPSSNPWSLPFAHKPIFAEKVEEYDLFIYSEDDMAVTEKNIQAFVQITPQLQEDEIAGFLRYEISPTGVWSLPEMHGFYRWKLDSAARRGVHAVAEFNNEHAAFYLLTRAQLKRAIASGGFLRAPYEGRYDMLCAAATDPYTSCGFRKVICLTAVEDFLIHHVPNRYANQLGLPLAAFKEQVQTLVDISNGNYPAIELCQIESKMLHAKWSKFYDEKPVAEILTMVPKEARSILAIGSGWGLIETELQKQGASVTALPLDSSVGPMLEKKGMEVIYGTLGEAFKKLGERRFDCVLLTDLLHLQSDAERVLEQCSRFVGSPGALVVSGPNFQSLSILAKRTLNKGDHWKLKRYADGGIQIHSARHISRLIKNAGMDAVAESWFNRIAPKKWVGARRLLGRFAMDSWVVGGYRRANHSANRGSRSPAKANSATNPSTRDKVGA